MKRIFVTLVIVLGFAGCSDGIGLSQKPQFYEYEGGLINLSQVSVVATQATISVSEAPRGPQGEYGTETRALYEAHLQFCRQSLSISDYIGGIPGSARALKKITSDISAQLSNDVIDTCAIEINVSAAIILDNFTITQASGKYTLPVASELNTEKTEELANAISTRIDQNVRQPSEWEAQYRALKSKVSL